MSLLNTSNVNFHKQSPGHGSPNGIIKMQQSLQLLSMNKTTAFASQLNHKTNIFLNSSLKTHLFAQLNARMNSEIPKGSTKNLPLFL